MRRTILGVVASFGFIMLWTSPLLADSCSGRVRVCQAYCEKVQGNSPICLGNCQDSLAQCKSTGCWESRVVARRCGFARQ